MRRIKLSRGFKQFAGGIIIGGILMGIVALFSAHMVEKTGNAEFCGICHEVEVFCETWEEGMHGWILARMKVCWKHLTLFRLLRTARV